LFSGLNQGGPYAPHFGTTRVSSRELDAPAVKAVFCFFTAALAHALIWCAGQNPLDARKIRRQFLAARMFARSLRPVIHWPALTRRLHYHFTDHELKLEQFHLRAGELFAARSILFDPHPSQTLFQNANLQLCVPQPALQLCDEVQIGWY
jgi:hypothetical protein